MKLKSHFLEICKIFYIRPIKTQFIHYRSELWTTCFSMIAKIILILILWVMKFVLLIMWKPLKLSLRGLSTFAPEFRAYFWRWIAKKLHMILTQSFFYLIITLLKFKKKNIFFFSLSWPWRVLESISAGAT